tara:strand:- start:21 stop:1979 length:1959 start_codon:yes stop_codon:yes gene_type:complete
MAIEKEYTLKLSTADAQANVDELNKSLELQESLIEDIEKEIRQYEKQLNKTSKTDLAAQKKIKDALTKKKEALKDEKIALKDLNKERKKSNEELKEATENTADYSGVLGIVDQKTGGLISGMKNLTGGIGGATKGFNLMKIAIIGTGIGALLIAITSVTAAFKSSEEGQNKFAKIMGVIGSVVGNLVDLLADLGEGIISAFEDPKQAIIDFKDFIVQNITNRFNAAIDTVGFLGSAIKKVFSGDFSGAMEDAKSAGSSYVDVLTGVENTIGKVTEATKEFVKEIVEEGKIAGQIADQRARADKLDRQLIVERAEANRKRAELLEKAANKEIFTALQRIEFLTEAGALEEEITKKELVAAKLRYDAKVAENALSKSTKEDLAEEAQLKANLINLEAARLTKQKLVTSQIVAAEREEAARLKAIKDAEDLAEAEKQKEKDVAEKLRLDTIAKENKQRALDEIELEKQKTAAKEKAFSDAIAIAGAESRLGKAIFIAKQLLQAREMIMEMKGTLFSAKQSATKTVVKAAEAGVDVSAGAAKAAAAAPFPANIPLILGYAAQAVGIVSAIRGAMKASKAVTSPLGVSEPTPSIEAPTMSVGSIPPSFNTVGASGTNQLADAIGGQSQIPVQAFVVSGQVTTAQELDRNIIEDATIG